MAKKNKFFLLYQLKVLLPIKQYIYRQKMLIVTTPVYLDFPQYMLNIQHCINKFDKKNPQYYHILNELLCSTYITIKSEYPDYKCDFHKTTYTCYTKQRHNNPSNDLVSKVKNSKNVRSYKHDVQNKVLTFFVKNTLEKYLADFLKQYGCTYIVFFYSSYQENLIVNTENDAYDLL